MKLSMEKRGTYKNTTYIDPTRADLEFEFPLSEIIFDFYDKLKSTTRGYASFDYNYIGYNKADLVKLDILFNSEIQWMLFQLLCIEVKHTITEEKFAAS